MANLGEKTEIVNASELTLEVGADNYIMLTSLNIHASRPEERTATTDAGALYTYGKGDHWFDATLLITHPEAITINTLNEIDANGDMTETIWLVKGKGLDGTTVTWTCTGILRSYDIRKPEEGKVEIDISVRITGDTLTVA